MSAAAPDTLVIEAVESAGAVAASSTGAVLFALFSFVLFAFGFASGGAFALVTGFFAFFGVIALVMAIRQNINLVKYGAVKLTLQAPLPALAGHLHALIRLPEEAAQADRIEGRLVVQRVYKKGRVEDVKEDWAQVWQFPVRRGEAAALLFDIPAELPSAVQAGQGTLSRTTWQVSITAEVPGVDFSRSFDIPVSPAQPETGPVPKVERSVPSQAPVIVEEAAEPKQQAQPASGSAFSAAALVIVFNLVPMFGVAVLGWKTADIIWLYWYENIVIGLLHAVRLLLPQSIPVVPKHMVERGLTVGPDQMIMAKGVLAAFFLTLYGAFCFGHAEFITALFGSRHLLQDNYLFLAVIALVASHLWSLRGEIAQGPRPVDLRAAMIRPYGRIVVIHVFLIVGGLALMHGQVAALVVFVAVKIAVDVYMQRREQQRFGIGS